MEEFHKLYFRFVEEDRRLRELILRFPAELRERPGEGKLLGLKQTLAHLAQWDGFTVRFFAAKIAGAPLPPDSFSRFETEKVEERERLCRLPFGRVLTAYARATEEMLSFLRRHWLVLTERERGDFRIPLRHRAHHRELLARSLARHAHDEPRVRAGIA